MLSFNDYCDDILDQHMGLMGRAERDQAWSAYQQHIQAAAPARKALSNKALDARNIAKMFGGKALLGSSKQKEWAEKIRAEKLAQMDEAGAALACRADGLGKHCKFWIDNRARTGAEIADFFGTQTTLLAQYKHAHGAGDGETVKQISAEYNALTAAWGF